MLSKRLQQVADAVVKADTIADIGTDHAYIPIYLINKGVAKRAVAADISSGSCKKAQINIGISHLSNYIDVRCGNGLEVISENEAVDTIIIAGMGGLMTISVLESNKRATANSKQLVLQPQKDIEKVRRYIHSIGFKINDEKMLVDNDKYYTVIDARKGSEKYTDIEYLFGKKLIEAKSPVLKEYVEFESNKLLKVLDNMIKNGKENSEAYKRMYELSCKYAEVKKCL